MIDCQTKNACCISVIVEDWPVFNYDRYTASILCLAVYHSALISEILRAGINAVAQGQWEAAKSIGMSKTQTYRYIILPQSIKFLLPPMTGEVVHMVKSFLPYEQLLQS